ncbi:MAG: hypothetical protein ACRD3L_13405 [Terriglobales bacterium]
MAEVESMSTKELRQRFRACPVECELDAHIITSLSDYFSVTNQFGSNLPKSTAHAPHEPDIEGWRGAFGRDIPPFVKEFLDYRHCEWELNMESDLLSGPKTKRGNNLGGTRS